MATKIDIVTDENADLWIQNGDFVVGNATAKQAEVILNATEGDLRQFPTLGVGLNRFIGSIQPPEYLENIAREQLKSDDIVLINLSLTQEEKNSFKLDLEVE